MSALPQLRIVATPPRRRTDLVRSEWILCRWAAFYPAGSGWWLFLWIGSRTIAITHPQWLLRHLRGFRSVGLRRFICGVRRSVAWQPSIVRPGLERW